MSSLFSLVIFSLLHLLRHPATAVATGAQPVTAVYVFGDSTVDPGNNNYLPASFKANHYPYGEDYPGRVPTGRFSDGLIAPDFIAGSLGLKKYIPAYLDPAVTDRDLLTGVSFASGGSGLDDLTVEFTGALDLTAQIGYFQDAVNRMERTVGREKTSWAVKNAMVLISVGTNDMVINYFDLPSRALQFSASSYADFLINRLGSVIQSLYNLGARRFVVAGLAPVGCLPLQVSLDSVIPSLHWLQRVCVDSQNDDARLYNTKLQSLLNNLQSQHSDATFVYSDLYSTVQDMINRPQAYGFERTLEGCCGTGDLELGDLCNSKNPICPNPSAYLFWDAIHPSQATHHIIADSLLPIFLSKLH